MKQLLLGCVPLAALAAISSATAAELPVRKAPPVVSAFNWTGCYLNGYVGGAWQGGDGATFTDLGQNGIGPAGSIAVPPFLSCAGGAAAARLVPAHSWNADLGSSFIGGGTVGCNWQPVNSPFVLGLEGETGYMRLSGTPLIPVPLSARRGSLTCRGAQRSAIGTVW
jgi:outer membrane immunogenic protein